MEACNGKVFPHLHTYSWKPYSLTTGKGRRIPLIEFKKGMEGMERYGKGLSPLGSRPHRNGQKVCMVWSINPIRLDPLPSWN